MSGYIALSEEMQERIRDDRAHHRENPYAFREENVMRRLPDHDRATLWRPAFVRDTEKIMNIPYYNRYGDKTQVFSLMKNDDITRRMAHVQFVSRIARNIGAALNLNLDLIEAISLGHDIGHTPFGHAGERKLSELYHAETGRYFNHNIQSARVLDTIFPVNISLQTLDGIICHNGELELEEYRPVPNLSFELFDRRMEDSCTRAEANKELVPGTLEACVMRVSDIIAYIGKDRQDAVKVGLLEDDSRFANETIGSSNAQIIHNMIVNVIERSYGEPFLRMDRAFYEAFSRAKKENYEQIYRHDANTRVFEEQIYPMFEEIYAKLLKDLKSHDTDSVIYRHHIAYRNAYAKFCKRDVHYEEQEPNAIVVDYIASMTDDYFIDLYDYLFPGGKHRVQYIGYFDEK